MGRNGDRQDLRIVDVGSGKTNTLGAAGPSRPVWTPDGRFLVGTAASGEVRWMKTDGSAAAGILIPSGDTIRIPWSFDADGSHLAFYQRGTRGTGSVTFDLWTVPITIGRDSMKAGEPKSFLVSDAFEVYPAFSPDGRWIAYTSLESAPMKSTWRRSRTEDTRGESRRMVEQWQLGLRTDVVSSTRQRTSASWLSTGAVSDGVSLPAQQRLWTDTRARRRRSRPGFRCSTRRAGCGAAEPTAIGRAAACESGHVGVQLVYGIAPPRAPLNGHTGSQTSTEARKGSLSFAGSIQATGLSLSFPRATVGKPTFSQPPTAARRRECRLKKTGPPKQVL